jgi:hypothetical protein
MKKILILTILLVTYSNIFALLTQGNWRWRNDDGTETSATWKDAQNTQPILTTKGEIWRLRLELYNNTGGSYPFLDTLQYATSPAGPWTNIDKVTSSNPFMIAGISAFVTQAELTTPQLAGFPYSFASGKVMVDSMVLKNLNLADQQRIEIEWAIKITPNILTNTTYYFRQEWSSTVQLGPGMTYPSLITAGLLPIKFTGFTASREDEKVKLEWIATSEQNNARFEIQRSPNGRTWKTIDNIKGRGLAASNAYRIYDESPLSGINYYMIKQYDADGHFYQSDVKFVKMPETKSIISVYPNPAHSAVSFSIVNKSATNVEVFLSKINGTIIYKKIFQNVSANTINKLNLQHQPTPGIYVLRLKAKDISESVRVVIQ